ncbi:MAG: hypothetical protein JRH20_11105 [Deltaproteobacteria bacterium]|nr:hypothetical protein [Deltaproteobacteria bacterium]
MRALGRFTHGCSPLLLGASALLFSVACDSGIDYAPSGPDSWPDSGVFDLPAVTPDAPPPENHCVKCHTDQALMEEVADFVPPPPPPDGES